MTLIAVKEAAAARGTMAFRRVTLKPLQAAMEAITEAASTDEVNDQTVPLKEALGGLSEAVDSSNLLPLPSRKTSWRRLIKWLHSCR